MLDTCIGDFYLRPERPSLAALHLEVRRKFCEQQLPATNYRTVKRRVEALDLKFVIEQREGSKKAREKLGRSASLPCGQRYRWMFCKSTTPRWM